MKHPLPDGNRKSWLSIFILNNWFY
jgi:hypothetical protein